MKKLLSRILAWIRARWAKAQAPAPIPVPPKESTPMAAVDFSGMSAKLDKLNAYASAMKDELAIASANADKVVALQASLDASNADLAASKAAETDAETKLQAALDAIAAILPAQAPAAV